MHDLSGWDAIEDYTGMSASTPKRLAKRAPDPFPVIHYEGVRKVWADKKDIDEWAKRNVRRSADAVNA